MKNKYIKILFFIFIYLTGRVCMVLVITSDNDGKRYISCQQIPQNVAAEITAAFQKEERTAPHTRNIIFLPFEFESRVTLKTGCPYAFSSRYSQVYSGHYIDPPKLA